MKIWSTPEILELDIKMTASGSVASTSEKAGYLNGANGWIRPTHNATTHVYNEGGQCVMPKDPS